jgi:tetratricopeptide (TPR) repeat protein
VLLAGPVALLIYLRSRVALFVAGAAFLVFLPSSNLIFPIGTIMAERFLYLPAIAFAAAIVWAVYRIAPRPAPAILGALIAIFAIRTFARNADWQDDLTLSTSAVSVCPTSFKTHKMRANALLESDPAHANLDQVIAEAEESLAILDLLPSARNSFDTYDRAAGYYFMQGDRLRQRSPGDAVRAWQRSVELYQRALTIARLPAPDTYLQLAKLYLRLGRQQQAIEAAQGARQLGPNDPATHRTLAGVLLDAGRDQDAFIALLTGAFITQDQSLRDQVYRAVGPPDFCSAAGDITRLRPDLAAKVTELDCR